jgi:hypothetical protein
VKEEDCKEEDWSRVAATIFAGRRADATSKATQSIAERGATRRKTFLGRPFSVNVHDIKSEKRVCGNLEGIVSFSTSCPTGTLR